MQPSVMRGRAARALRAVGRRSVDFLTPPACPVTGERLADPDLLSGSAWGAIQFIDDPMCPRCGLPFPFEEAAGPEPLESTLEEAPPAGESSGLLCGACLAAPPPFEAARSAVAYDDASKRLVISFKHGDKTHLSRLFAGWLVRAGAGLLDASKADASASGAPAVIVPTPLHWRRLLARRYNQAALLAHALSARTGLPVAPRALRRVRPTPPQKDLSWEARARNVAGAFEVAGAARPGLEGARVILVDDVHTSGATLAAAARTLKKAGAARVDALTLARVVKRGGIAI